MVAVAVKVTFVPLHIVFPLLDEIITDGVTIAFTVMVMLLLVADKGEAHDKLLVITQLIMSLFNRLVIV